MQDFMARLATDMGKKPADMQRFVKVFEDNWLETEDDLKGVSDSQWKELGLPMGLVNKIKAHLGGGSSQP